NFNPLSRSRSPRRGGWRAASRRAARAGPPRRRRARRAARRERSPLPRSPARGARARRPPPAGRGSPPSGGSARVPPPGAGLGEPVGEGPAGDALVGLDVAGTRARDHVVGDRGCGGLLVPAAARSPVAYVLLVEARLPAADLVFVCGPVPR